jgi:hypothetical protein
VALFKKKWAKKGNFWVILFESMLDTTVKITFLYMQMIGTSTPHVVHHMFTNKDVATR